MLDLKNIRENPEEIKEGIKKKGAPPELIDEILSLDEKRRKLLLEIETIRHKKSEAEERIAQGLKEESLINTLKEVKIFLDNKESDLKVIEEQLNNLIYKLPNLPLAEVPVGQSESDNKIIKTWGKIPKFNFPPKDYLTLGEDLDLIDTKRAAKTSGSRFGFLKGAASILEIALINFAFHKLTKKGFVPVFPPVMIKPKMFKGMGYIDFSDEEAYFLAKDNLYLVGTSEQIIGPMHADEIFEEKELPKRYVAFSSCFRREAGSYGKDTRGILRVHQFDKVEMFIFSKPEESIKEHAFIRQCEEELMQALHLPYRLVQLCTLELAQPSATTYDIETWLPGQNNYRETHSSSNCTDFQARRLNIKYRLNSGEIKFVHTLNGTAFAMGRMIIAILENYQQKDGSIKIPKALWPYTFGLRLIKK